MNCLKYYKDINLPQYSIFYSGYIDKDKIILYGRRRYNQRRLLKAILSLNLNVINVEETNIRAEDPRFFIHNDFYIVDNFWNDVHLYNINTSKYTRINCKGKNFPFFSEKKSLYFLKTIKPISIKEVDIETGHVYDVKYNNDINEEIDDEYRGGTSFFQISNQKIAFGHRTYNANSVLKHDPFLIVLSNGRFKVKNIVKPNEAKNIMDPTNIFVLNKSLYLMTAESDNSWFCIQKYYNRIYKIACKPRLNMLL